MFNRRSKLTAWILTAALTISALSTTVSATDVLPSVGAGSSISVIATDTVAAAEQALTPAAKTAVKTTVLPSAGVEAAAGGIASLTVIETDVPDTAAQAQAPAEAAEIATDVEAMAVIQDTVAAEPITLEAGQEEAMPANLSTTLMVPADIANDGVQTVSGNNTDQAADGEASEDAEAVTGEVANQALAASAPEAGAESIVSGSDAAADSAREMYSNLVIAKCNDCVNVRKGPSEETEVLGKLYNESVGDYVSEADGGWIEIISGTVRGYVKAEYVVTGEEAVQRAKEVGKRLAKVNTTRLYVRETPSTDASVIGMVPGDDVLTVVEEAKDGWVKVSVEEGEGFVSTDYVTLMTEFVKAESKEEEAARLAKEKAEREAALAAAAKKAGKKKGSGSKGGGGSYAAPSGGNGSAVASYALQFVGNPYVYGGSSLTNGTDCSGFTMSVYAAFGVGLPHSSGAQRSCGTDVGGLANAQPGDLVCYSGHVGIYIGNGQIVHASTAKTGIKVSNAGYRSVLSVRRIF